MPVRDRDAPDPPDPLTHQVISSFPSHSPLSLRGLTFRNSGSRVDDLQLVHRSLLS